MMADVVKFTPKPRVEDDARQGEGAQIHAFPDREQEIENERLERLADWLTENEDWLIELVLERAEEPFRDRDHLSEWVQHNWHGSDTFIGAPLEGLRWQATNDMVFHSIDEYDFEALQLA